MYFFQQSSVCPLLAAVGTTAVEQMAPSTQFCGDNAGYLGMNDRKY